MVDNADLVYDLRWRRPFFIKVLLVFENILSLLLDVILSRNIYKWIWKHQVFSAYHDQLVVFSLSLMVKNLTLHRIRVSWASLKVLVFFFQLLQDEFP